MKYSYRRILAILLALLVAFPAYLLGDGNTAADIAYAEEGELATELPAEDLEAMLPQDTEPELVPEEPVWEEPAQEEIPEEEPVQEPEEILPESEPEAEIPVPEESMEPEQESEDADTGFVIEEEEPEVFEDHVPIDGMIVSIKAEPGTFPEDAYLSVEAIPEEDKWLAETALSQARKPGQNIVRSNSYDIKVMLYGMEIEPVEGKYIALAFSLPEVRDKNLRTSVYHITEKEVDEEDVEEAEKPENEKPEHEKETDAEALIEEQKELVAERMNVTIDEEAAIVVTTKFSYYTVEFSYDSKMYTIYDSSTLPLTDILTAVGLTGTVSNVAVSNEALFSASNVGGEWFVTPHQPFETMEWMQVTIRGYDYLIMVINDTPVTAQVTLLPITPAVSIDGWTYGETAATPSVTGNDGNGAVTYEYKAQGAEDTAYTATVPTKAGDYTIRATIAETEEYESGSATADFTIAQKPVTITGLTVADKEYDGTTIATIQGSAVIDGKKDADDVSVALVMPSFPDKNVGTGKAISFADSSLIGEDAGNYDLEDLVVTANITPKPVTATVTAKDRDYIAGQNTVELIAGEVKDAITGDTVTVDVSSATGTMADENAGTSKAVTVTGVTLGGADAANYTLNAQPSGVTVNISKINWTTTEAAGSTNYGNNGTVDLSSLIASGGTSGTITVTDEDNILNGMPTVTETTLNYTFVDDTKQVGKTATISIPITSTNYNDYTIVVTVTVTDKAAQIVTFPNTNVTKTYGDSAFSTETATSSGNGTISYSSTNSSVATVNSVTGEVTIVGAGNTVVIATATETPEFTAGTSTYRLTVNKKTVTATVTATGRAYEEGKVMVSLEKGIVNGKVSGDDVEVDVSSATAVMTDDTAGTGKAVTVTGVTLSGADVANYTLSEQPTGVTVDIDKAMWTNFAAEGIAKYGNSGTVNLYSLVAPGGTMGTLSVADDDSMLNGTPTVAGTVLSFAFKDDAALGGKSAKVTIPVTNATNYADYDITVTLNVLTDKLPITPTVSIGDWTYGEAADAPITSGNSGNGAELYEYKIQGAADSTYTTTVPTNAGDYTVRVTVAETGAYQAGTATYDFTIAKADWTEITATANMKYGFGGMIDLTDMIAPGGSLGTPYVYEDLNHVLDGTPTLTYGKYFRYKFEDVPLHLGSSAIVNIPATGGGNYNDYTITITLNVVSTFEHTHDWHLVVLWNPVSCTSSGTATYRCSLCGEYTNTTIVGGGHWPRGGWHSDATSHWQLCGNCAQEINKANHESAGPATEGAPEVCRICGYVMSPRTPVVAGVRYYNTGSTVISDVQFVKNSDDPDDTSYTVFLPEKRPEAPGFWFEGWRCSEDGVLYEPGTILTYEYAKVRQVSFNGEWTQVIGAGTYDLVSGVRYRLAEGTYLIDGDGTVYNGGQYVYLQESGIYTVSESAGD